MKALLKPSLNWLLVFVPAAVVLHYAFEEMATWTFIAACLSVIPLAGWMGRATEHLAENTNEGIGGLLNATFGNAAEFIIAFFALRSGLTEIVKASLTGSIIGNILLVLGAAFLGGGLRHRAQRFNALGARAQATLLTLAAIALVAPAAFHHVADAQALASEDSLSVGIAIVLLVAYGLGLLFSLKTHRHLFDGRGSGPAPGEDPLPVGEAMRGTHDGHAPAGAPWSLKRSFAVLVVATTFVGWISEILVATVEHAAEAMSMNGVFIGVIVVAVIGNAAEHSTAVLVSLKNRMDLSIGIAIGSSIQVALFVAPVLVLVSHAVAPEPLDLIFTLPEVVAVALAVAITAQIAGDGESNWLEGVLLLAVYGILGIVFYYLPSGLAP